MKFEELTVGRTSHLIYMGTCRTATVIDRSIEHNCVTVRVLLPGGVEGLYSHPPKVCDFETEILPGDEGWHDPRGCKR